MALSASPTTTTSVSDDNNSLSPEGGGVTTQQSRQDYRMNLTEVDQSVLETLHEDSLLNQNRVSTHLWIRLIRVQLGVDYRQIMVKGY